MFCIAAFIVLIILSVFSARYRRLAADAWKCVARRVTFRKCDTNFKEDLKSRLLGKMVLRRPRLAKFLDKWLDVLAFVFVVLTVWSLVVVVRSGLNLFVYDTCNPANAESCSLGAEACSIPTVSPSFWQSLKSGHILGWTMDQAGDFGETISRVPDRIKKWNPADYTDDKSSYYYPYDATKPTALEVIDPGCQFCAKLFNNIKQAGVENRYNLTYIPYPIPDPSIPSGYKFANSKLVASYLQAVKLHPLQRTDNKVAADWQILERIFNWQDSDGTLYQMAINNFYSDKQTEDLLRKWLGELGYSQEQIQTIVSEAGSATVQDRLANGRAIVEKQIRTVKIPTLLINGRRFDGVVSADKLH